MTIYGPYFCGEECRTAKELVKMVDDIVIVIREASKEATDKGLSLKRISHDCRDGEGADDYCQCRHVLEFSDDPETFSFEPPIRRSEYAITPIVYSQVAKQLKATLLTQ